MGVFDSFDKVKPPALLVRYDPYFPVLVFLVHASVVRRGREIGFPALRPALVLAFGPLRVALPLLRDVGPLLVYMHCGRGF